MGITHSVVMGGSDDPDYEASKDAWNDTHDVDTLLLPEQGSNPSTPAAGHWVLFVKSGGVYARNAAGTVVGPFAASSGFADPMTTRGDIIVRNASNATDRLAVGAAGRFLSATATDAVWGQGPLTTTGDLMIGATGGTPSRLAVGGANTLLHGGSTPAYSAVLPADLDVSADNTTADATTGHHGLLPKLGGGSTNFLRADGTWNAPASGMTNPMTTRGDVILGDTSGTPTRLAAGTSAHVLTSNGAAAFPSWQAVPSGFSNPMTTRGDVILGDTSGTPTRLAAGTAAYVLTSNGTAAFPSWQAASSGFADPMTTRGDIIVRASGGTDRLAVGGAGEVLTSDGTDVSWEAPTGGGGHSYIGHNTIGGSTKNLAGSTAYCQKVTLASAGWIMSIAAYLSETADNTFGWMSAIYADAAGDLGDLLSTANSAGNTVVFSDGTPPTPMWISQGHGLYVPAGDYWICIGMASSSGGSLVLAYDTGGSDKTFATGGGGWWPHGARYTRTDSTHTHSIRADFLG